VASGIEVQPRPNDKYICGLWWDFDSSVPMTNSKLTLDSISLDYFSTEVIFSVQSQEGCCWTAGNWNSTPAEFLNWAFRLSVFQGSNQLSLEYVFNLKPKTGTEATIREKMESEYFCAGNAKGQDLLGPVIRHTTQRELWGECTYEVEELG